MDPKKARETLKRLCAEWDRAGQLMNRYVRPAGFSLVLGVGVATSAGCSSTVSSDSARDALPPSADAYGAADRPVLDGRVNIVDSAQDALPPSADAYGTLDRPVLDRPPIPRDGGVDIVDSAKDALPNAVDIYGVSADGRVDIVDSARDALPPAHDVYGVVTDRPPLPRDGGVDSPAVDALLDAADAADAIAALDGADSGAGD